MKYLLLYFLSSLALLSQETLLLNGPMLGYSDKREVVIWLQTGKPASVQIRFWPQGNQKASKLTAATFTTNEQDLTAHIMVENLEPGSKYGYDVVINNKTVFHSDTVFFQTQALWEWRTDAPDFKVAFGSCVYVNEPVYDRPGTPYGRDAIILESIADQKPDFMMWLGDNIYLREVDWNSKSGISHRYRHARGLTEFKRLFANMHNYAIWDDHDFGPNDSDRGFLFKNLTLEAFRNYWANPSYGRPETPGVFFQFRWSDVDFFMLDDRYYRSPNNLEDSPEKTQLGPAQMQWLKDALLFSKEQSKVSFRVIAIGGQVLNEANRFESFNMFSYERAELLNFIKKYRIPGVVFLTGDIHHSELIKKDDPNFYTLYEYTSSPLTSGLHADDGTANPQLVPNTKITNTQSFGMLRFSGKQGDRKMVMECLDPRGKKLWDFSINENDLKVKKK